MKSVGWAVYRDREGYGIVSKVSTRGRAEGRRKVITGYPRGWRQGNVPHTFATEFTVVEVFIKEPTDG